MVIIDLAARSFGRSNVFMMKEEVKPAQYLLTAAAYQGDDLRGTQKAMPVDLPDNVAIPVRQLNRWNFIFCVFGH